MTSKPLPASASWASRLRRRVWLSERLETLGRHRLLFWAGLAGLLGSAASVGFRSAVHHLHSWITGQTGNNVASMAALPPWQRVVILAGGGLAAGSLLWFIPRVRRPSGSGDYMEAVAVGETGVSVRVSLLKSASSLLSIASGASIGREGPMVQLSAMGASILGRWWRLSPVERSLLVACGAAAGIASAYNAPIAGALFVAEILLGSLAMETFGPLVLASVISTLCTRLWMGDHPLFTVPPVRAGSLGEMASLAAVGIAAGLLAPLFLRTLRLSGRMFSNIPIWVRPGLGGLLVGGLACITTAVCGNGHAIVDGLLSQSVGWYPILLWFILKWLATSFTFGSGTVGGVFTPTLFLGASLGALMAHGFSFIWPGMPLVGETFVLIGMGSFLAATTHAPLMAILMVFEMTLDYNIILPLMLSCVVAQQISQAIKTDSIYSEVLRKKGDKRHKSHLAKLRVGDLMKAGPPTVMESTPFPEITELFIARRFTWLFVTDATGHWRGAISLHDIKLSLQQPELATLVIAGDLLRTDFATIRREDSLELALERFSGHESERLPVVDSSPDPLLLGALHKSDVLLAIAGRSAAFKS